MRKRTFILIAMIATLLIAALCGGSCAAAEKEPLLKNLAFAEAKVDDGAVIVTYGGETLNADLDYMIYTKDGETLIQGIGEYAGSIVLDDGELRK